LLQGTGLRFEYLTAKSVRILAPELAQAGPTEQSGGAATDIQVVVTGSRLPQAPNDISTSPITSVTADDIQKTGLVRVDDILDSLILAVRGALPFYPQTAHIPAYTYIDLAFAIPIGGMVDFRLGVNNIADKDPPVILNGNFSDCPNTSCNDNTWVGTYDTLGRYIYAHLSAKF
jgi:hypothetical protein